MSNNKTNPNDPAHPTKVDGFENDLPGLTKREHFAAQALDKIPDWFKPALTEKPKIRASVRTYFENHSYGDVIRKNFDIEGYWLNEEGVEKKIIEEVNEWQKQREKELDALHQWNIKCQIDTYFQWRTFYADALIEQLNK